MELSARGRRAQARPFSYFDAFIKTFSDSYDADKNATGFINLAVAQNSLTVDLMHERFCRAMQTPPPLSTAAYDDMKGTHDLRAAMAKHMKKRLIGLSACTVFPEDLVLSAGAGAVIENLVFCVCDEDDEVMIPAPFYPAFPNDLRARLGVKTVPVYDSSSALPDGATLPTVQDFENALTPRTKMILLSNPGNPTGVNYTDTDEATRCLMDVIAWAVERGVHVISDEIYACSIFEHSENSKGFFSAIEYVNNLAPEASIQDHDTNLKHLAQRPQDYVHVIYGLSKDFCTSGYRVGALWTKNADIHRALDNVSYFCAIPGPMQYALSLVLEDDDFLDHFFVENCARLRKQYDIVTEELSRLSEDDRWVESHSYAPQVRPNAGMFVYFNLQHLLPQSPTFVDEQRLWSHIYEAAKVVLTPGNDCASREAGWFRMCFAAVDSDTLRVGIRRVVDACKSYE